MEKNQWTNDKIKNSRAFCVPGMCSVGQNKQTGKNQNYMQPFAQDFEIFTGIPTTALDLKHHHVDKNGKTSEELATVNFQAYVDDIVSQISQRKVVDDTNREISQNEDVGDIILIGHSLGGAIVTDVREKLKKTGITNTVLVGTMNSAAISKKTDVFPPTKQAIHLFWPAAKDVTKKIISKEDGIFTYQPEAAQQHIFNDLSPEDAAEYSQALGHESTKVFWDCLKGLDIHPEKRETQKTVHLASSGDLILPSEISSNIAEVTGGQFHLIEGPGHHTIIESQKALHKLVEGFGI